MSLSCTRAIMHACIFYICGGGHPVKPKLREWLLKIVKKMSLKDKERIEKLKEDKDNAMVIRKVDANGVKKVSHGNFNHVHIIIKYDWYCTLVWIYRGEHPIGINTCRTTCAYPVLACACYAEARWPWYESISCLHTQVCSGYHGKTHCIYEGAFEHPKGC